MFYENLPGPHILTLNQNKLSQILKFEWGLSREMPPLSFDIFTKNAAVGQQVRLTQMFFFDYIQANNLNHKFLQPLTSVKLALYGIVSGDRKAMELETHPLYQHIRQPFISFLLSN